METESPKESSSKSNGRTVLAALAVTMTIIVGNLVSSIRRGDFKPSKPEGLISFESLGVNPALSPYRIDLLHGQINGNEGNPLSISELRSIVATLSERRQRISLYREPERSTNREDSPFPYRLDEPTDQNSFKISLGDEEQRSTQAWQIVMQSGLPIEIRSKPIE